MDRQLVSLFHMLAPSGTSIPLYKTPDLLLIYFSHLFISLLFFSLFFLEEKIFLLGSWFQRVQSWLLGPKELRQNIMVTGRRGKRALPQDGQKAWCDGKKVS